MPTTNQNLTFCYLEDNSMPKSLNCIFIRYVLYFELESFVGFNLKIK